MTGLISVGFLEAKIQLYESEPVLYSQGGHREEAPQTDLLGISRLQPSSVLHVTLLALLRERETSAGADSSHFIFIITLQTFYLTNKLLENDWIFVCGDQ